MSRAHEQYQDELLADLERRVQDLEGEVSVPQDHRAILQQLDLIKRETSRLAMSMSILIEMAVLQNARLAALVDLLEPKGSVVINVGVISEIN